jgi:hypothetical protein
VKPSALALLSLALAGCGSTGNALVTFHAAGAGPAGATAGQPLVFTNGRGYQVTLTQARLHIGAVYLNRSVPISGAQAQPCILPGIYTGQVTSPLDVDALSPDLQFFAADGEGTADESLTGEVWLFGSDVNATADTTVLASVEGTAVGGGGASFAFTGRITIGTNRAVPVNDPSLPGANPLCKQRIVTPIPIDIRLAQGGTLVVRVDPRSWLNNVDFAQIPPDPQDPARRRFLDLSQGQPDLALYGGVRSTSTYVFEWRAP